MRSGSIPSYARLAAVVAAVTFACTSCAGTSRGEPSQADLVVSEDCTAGSIFEWDASPGPTTRLGAVEEILAMFEKNLRALPSDAGRSETNDTLEDPVKLMVGIRGLDAIIVDLKKAEAAVGPDEDLEMAVTNPDGQVIARATISSHSGGGYRVEDFSGTGWTTDDPSCGP